MFDSFATLWTEAHQAPLSMGFPRQEDWSGLPFSSSMDLPRPGIKPVSPALAGGFFTTESPGKPKEQVTSIYNIWSQLALARGPSPLTLSCPWRSSFPPRDVPSWKIESLRSAGRSSPWFPSQFSQEQHCEVSGRWSSPGLSFPTSGPCPY